MLAIPEREHDVWPLVRAQLQLLSAKKTRKVSHDIDVPPARWELQYAYV